MKRLKKKIIIAALFVGMSLIFAGCSNQNNRIETKTNYLMSDDYVESDLVEAKWESRMSINFFGPSFYDEFVVLDSNKSLYKVQVFDDELWGQFMTKTID